MRKNFRFPHDFTLYAAFARPIFIFPDKRQQNNRNDGTALSIKICEKPKQGIGIDNIGKACYNRYQSISEVIYQDEKLI